MVDELELNKIYNMDCIDGLKKISDDSIDLIVTDPPYGLTNLNPLDLIDDESIKSKGFMGKKWDNLPSVDIWNECLRVLKPGAFAFVMAIPRQDALMLMQYRLAKSGFNIKFTSLYHVFASGFPKSSNISKMVDKKSRRDYVLKAIELGVKPKDFKRSLIDWTKEEHSPSDKYCEEFKRVISREDWEKIEREVTGKDRTRNNIDNIPFVSRGKFNRYDKSATSKAKLLDGSFAGFQPKPAVEIILVVMKPLQETDKNKMMLDFEQLIKMKKVLLNKQR